MKRSTDRIRTTHAGRLPVSPGLENLPVRLYLGEVVDPAVIAEGIAHGVAQAARSRHRLHRRRRILEGARLHLLQPPSHRHRDGGRSGPARPARRGPTPASATSSRSSTRIPTQAGTIFYVPGERPTPPERECTVATGPIKSKGTAALAQEIDGVQGGDRAGRAARWTRRSSACIAPGWLDHFIYNEYYKTDEEFIFALAEALREEYLAIVERRLHPADRRSRPRRLVGHAQAGAERRGISRQVCQAAHRCHQPCAEGHSGRPRALSPVLGLLARPAHPRPAVRAHRRA